MAWGDYHEVPYQSGLEEKIVGPFSFSKLAWIVPAIIVSNQVASVLPTLPFTDNPVFQRLHLTIPIIIALVFAYFKHGKTNLSLAQMMWSFYKIRKRKRVFYYKKENLSKFQVKGRET
ncbi:hypothetical protein [Bacillus piscicola]|uniref:hypothetical protein n=1 Tax=Bacillus piscicola TaxID=1632684 RepID=UPI001F09DFA7|nr:hypothetical protein [Bacillus piscicola]